MKFSLVSPGPATDLVPYAAVEDRLVVAHSPLGQGLLAGRRDRSSASGIRGTRRFAARGAERFGRINDALEAIAAAHGATPAQVALAWVIHHPNTVAIPGARTIEQLEQNAAAADIVLTDDEFARLTDEAKAASAG